MGWDGGAAHRPGPCANCGKPGQGVMGFNRHGMVCSRACATRLAKKVENGMSIRDNYQPLFSLTVDGHSERVDALRIRIKQLEAKVKALSR